MNESFFQPLISRFKNLSFSGQIIILVTSFIVVFATMVSLYITVNDRSKNLTTSWNDYQKVGNPLSVALSELNQKMGWGGLVFHVNRYLITSDPIQLSLAREDLIEAKLLTTTIQQRLKKPWQQELLSDFIGTLSQYDLILTSIETAGSDSVMKEQLSKIASIDNQPAINALARLTTSVHEQNLLNFTQSSDDVDMVGLLNSVIPAMAIPTLFMFMLGGALVIVNNIRIKEAEELVEKSRSASKAQSEFLANMSHEIRTPINGIVGMLDLLCSTKLTKDQLAYAQHSKESAKLLLRLIGTILDASKVEAGQIALRQQPINIEKLVVDIGRAMQPDAEKKNIEVFCPSSLISSPFVLGDELRITQILRNLVDNAIKFTEFGFVDVSVDVAKDSKNEDGRIVTFRVRDTGPGIKEKDLSIIFERFGRMDNSLTRKVGGAGLGLAISRELVELMGGEMGVDSEDGVGSTFWFQLPLKSGKQERLNIFRTPEVHIISCFKHPKYSFIVSNICDSWSVVSTKAKDVEDAVEIYAANQYGINILVIDAAMITIDKIPMIKVLRQRGCKTIFVNSRSDLTQKKVRQEFSDRRILKPISPQELYEAIVSLNSETVKERANSSFELQAQAEERPIRFKGRVLVAEDDPVSETVIRRNLEKLGLEVDSASNGKDAVLTMEFNHYDVVLMDCMMPIMDGYEAARKIRAGQAGAACKDIPIIALTANALSGADQQCFDAGMNDYLSKPLDQAKLCEKLSIWLTPNAKE